MLDASFWADACNTLMSTKLTDEPYRDIKQLRVGGELLDDGNHGNGVPAGVKSVGGKVGVWGFWLTGIVTMM